MSNGVNFRQLALDLRSELTKCQRLNAELLEALEQLRGVSLVLWQSSAEKIAIANSKADKAIAKARGEA